MGRIPTSPACVTAAVRASVGEVRGGEVLSLLEAWNAGHPAGVCTVHANHAGAGLRRIEQLIAEMSQTPMRALIAEAANLIVSIEPATPTLAANSCGRSEQQVMMVAVPRNQLNNGNVTK